MRTQKSIKNVIISAFFQLIGLMCNFVVRIFFIKHLGSQYLGLNGLLTNILQVLSLAELGIGEAINYSLYKPLAKKDNEKIKKLMFLYKKIYIFIGFFILISGLCFMPFVHFFIKDMSGISNLYLLFILFLLNTTVSYLYSYRWNIFVADQKKYIVNVYRYLIYSLFKVFQIVYLVLRRDFVGYMILQVISTFLENYILSLIAKKEYPFIVEKNIQKLSNEESKEIKKNIKAMMMHKVGNTLINSTDNIIISKFVGLEYVGIYSNYFMIFNSINVVFSQAYSALTSSVGNMYVDTNSEKQYEVFNKINFITFWLYSVSSIVLFSIINTFVEWWTGKEYLFNLTIVGLLILIFYINGMRKSILTFREASGLFYKDRWKSILEAIINLSISILLGIKLGVVGVFIGTLVSVCSISLWIEPYILFKYSFKKSLVMYFKTYIKYFLFTIFSSVVSFSLCSLIHINNILDLICKMGVSILLSNLLISIFFYKTKEFKFLLGLIKSKIWRKKENEKNRSGYNI